MPRKSHVLFFFVAAAVTSLQLCNGQAADGQAVVQRPSALGSVRFRSVTHESGTPTQHGSLVFKFNEENPEKSPHVFHNLMDAKLKLMDPSVQCSDNVMTLKLKWARAPHFLVDSGVGPLIPLSQMPSECGFTVKRSRRDVHFAAPYLGCHVSQQDGNYVLPLRLWGAPMKMSCPAASPPPPSVSCFPSGMVIKIGGITANELKVKVSGVWKSLSSVCSSCGFAVELFSGGVMLTVPYNRGLCVEIMDEEYVLSLLLADVEILVTCPSLKDIKPTMTTTPPTDSGQFLQNPQYPQFPMFAQYPFPGPAPPAHTPAPSTVTVAPLPQRPQLPSGAATDTENQETAAVQHPSFPFIPQYPQFPQYPLFPRPVPPTQSTANKNTAASPAQLPQVPQSPQYQIPFFPQFPMVPGIVHSTSPSPPPAIGTETLVTTPAPTTRHDGKPHVPQQPQFLMPPQYPFLPFPKLPLPPEGQTQAFQDPKPVIQQPKPYHAYPQTYQIPVLYPPRRYPSQRQSTQTAAPTPSTTSAATILKPAVQNPFYYPHPYMPAYYVPQTPMPEFPDPPTTPPANPTPPDQQEHQPVYRAMPPFYPFPSNQRPKSAGSDW
uniref:leucine-rich repeat extensin-like protein 5 n=1 Tax=Scatophagus argus TaxID=75038 RepID=UPI001ED7D811|nr:leucine-rich repeat extensin-like protein 5 [Scatophagus argus]